MALGRRALARGLPRRLPQFIAERQADLRQRRGLSVRLVVRGGPLLCAGIPTWNRQQQQQWLDDPGRRDERVVNWEWRWERGWRLDRDLVCWIGISIFDRRFDQPFDRRLDRWHEQRRGQLDRRRHLERLDGCQLDDPGRLQRNHLQRRVIRGHQELRRLERGQLDREQQRQRLRFDQLRLRLLRRRRLRAWGRRGGLREQRQDLPQLPERPGLSGPGLHLRPGLHRLLRSRQRSLHLSGGVARQPLRLRVGRRELRDVPGRGVLPQRNLRQLTPGRCG